MVESCTVRNVFPGWFMAALYRPILPKSRAFSQHSQFVNTIPFLETFRSQFIQYPFISTQISLHLDAKLFDGSSRNLSPFCIDFSTPVCYTG